MKEQTIIFGSPEPKKHSIRYKAQNIAADTALTDVYVRRSFLGQDKPQLIKVVVNYDLD